MNIQLESEQHSKLAFLVKKNLNRLKLQENSTREGRFDQLMIPFRRMGTFIDSKQILKQLTAPSDNLSLKKVKQPLSITKKQTYDDNNDNEIFYQQVDKLIENMEKQALEARDPILRTMEEMEELQQSKPAQQKYKDSLLKSKQLLAMVSKASRKYYQSKYAQTLSHLSINSHRTSKNSFQFPSIQSFHTARNNNQTRNKTDIDEHQEQPIGKKSMYSRRIQILIEDIDQFHKNEVKDTSKLNQKTSGFIVKQKLSMPKTQFKYLFQDAIDDFCNTERKTRKH